ncbi:MAG: 50S ribosomal protein L22/unknown domain fusion protein [Tenericutes bacterium ADurb.BinA124]|nr:MAG: 50S ribosomal protein L22/unknown domain fusion protein [Tenericutes bacterium ADurb.BinA124]
MIKYAKVPGFVNRGEWGMMTHIYIWLEPKEHGEILLIRAYDIAVPMYWIGKVDFDKSIITNMPHRKIDLTDVKTCLGEKIKQVESLTKFLKGSCFENQFSGYTETCQTALELKSILISIKPKYVEKILTGEKKYEFRRKIPQKPIKSIIVYCTAPYKKVVAEIQVLRILEKKPETLWGLTKDNSGMQKDDFFKYFDGCDVGYAYELGDIKRYEEDLNLEDIGITYPPQSFVYVSSNEFLGVIQRKMREKKERNNDEPTKHKNC